jgi:hypothetical protein
MIGDTVEISPHYNLFQITAISEINVKCAQQEWGQNKTEAIQHNCTQYL